MTRPVRVTVQCFKQLPHRPVIRDRVRHRQNRFEPETSLLIARQDSSAIRPGPIGVLDVVEAFGVGFPDVDAGVRDGVPVCVFDRAEDQQGLAGCILGDQRAVGSVLCFVRVEGSEEGSFGTVRGLGVVD
jgi:hypothetical protein